MGLGVMSRNSQHICAPLPHTQSPLSRSCPVLRHLPQRLTLDGLSSPPRVSLFFLLSFSKVLIFP